MFRYFYLGTVLNLLKTLSQIFDKNAIVSLRTFYIYNIQVYDDKFQFYILLIVKILSSFLKLKESIPMKLSIRLIWKTFAKKEQHFTGIYILQKIYARLVC